MKLIVSDAGPLIIMARSAFLEVLVQVVGQVVVPKTVYSETTTSVKPGAVLLRAAVQSELIRLIPDVHVSEHLENTMLDPGEKSAIAAALALSCPVLVDDLKARHVAKLHGLTVVGSAGILLVAKERGLVKRVQPFLDQWKSFGYFLSDRLIAQVLATAGEI